MTIAYVNAGALSSNVGVSSVTPALPASITAGNLLLLIVSKFSIDKISVPSGWTSLGNVLSDTAGSGLACYKIASGSDTAPTLSWSGGTTFCTAQIFQYSGAVGVGAFTSHGENTANHITAAFDSTSANSLAVYIDASRNSTELVVPSGWTSNSSTPSSYGSIATGQKQLTTTGSSSGAISTTGGFGCYMYQIELLASLPAISLVNSSSTSGYGVLSIPLPSSRVNGNLLLGVVDSGGNVTHTWPSGWTVIDQKGYGSRASSIAWRIVDGTESSPSVTSSTNYNNGYILQYSGTHATSPIGAVASNSNFGTALTCPAISTVGINSFVVYNIFQNSTDITVTPPGYTNNFIFDTISQSRSGIKSLTGGAGTSSGSSSATAASSSDWIFRQLELVKTLPAVPIDSPASSSGSASTSTIAGYGIPAAAESSGALTSSSTYIFAIGLFITSTANASAETDRKYYGSGIGLSEVNVSGDVVVAWAANLIANAVASISGSIVGERITNSIGLSSAAILDSAKGNFNLNVSAESSGAFTSSASVLRAISAAASASAALSSSAAVKAKYYLLVESIANVIDGIQFINEYWDGWAYNLNNEAPSFYEQYKFNSFAKLGQNYYGLNDAGIHLLSGATDNGSQIHSLIKTGQSDFDDTSLKTIPVLYAGARSAKEMILTASVDSNPDYSYIFIGTPTDLAPVRVKLGRGLKGRYWQLEVKNKDGAYIEIDQIDIPAVSTSRRV